MFFVEKFRDFLFVLCLVHRVIMIKSNIMINFCGQMQTLLIPPNQIQKCWQQKIRKMLQPSFNCLTLWLCNKMINLCVQTETLLIQPNQIYQCWLRKESAEQPSLCCLTLWYHHCVAIQGSRHVAKWQAGEDVAIGGNQCVAKQVS